MVSSRAQPGMGHGAPRPRRVGAAARALCAAALGLAACAGPPGTADGGTASTRLPRVTGRVVDALGTGLPGITVRVGGKGTLTGPKGTFTVPDVAVPYDVHLLPPAPAEDQMIFLGLTAAKLVLPLDPLRAPPTDPNGPAYAVTVTTTGGSAVPSSGNRITSLDIQGTLVGASPMIDTADVTGTVSIPGFPVPRETSFDVLAYRGVWDERTGESSFDVGATVRVPVVSAQAQASLKLVPLVSHPLTVKATGFVGDWSVWRTWLFDGRPPVPIGLPRVQSTPQRQIRMPVFTAGAPAVEVSTGGTAAEGGAATTLLPVPTGATTMAVALMPFPTLQIKGTALSLAGDIAWRHPKDSVCALTLGVLQPDFQVTAVTTASHASLAALGVPKAAAGQQATVELLCLGGYPSLDAAAGDPSFARRWAGRVPNARSQILPAELPLGP